LADELTAIRNPVLTGLPDSPKHDQTGDIEGTFRDNRPLGDLRWAVWHPVGARTPNVVLIALREAAGLSQQDLADELNDLAARKYGKHPSGALR